MHLPYSALTGLFDQLRQSSKSSQPTNNVGRQIKTKLPTNVREIPGGTAGTAATIAEMQRLAREASTDPHWVSWCRTVVSDLPSKDYEAEARRIYDVVKKNVRYVLDPRGLELVQDPRYIMFVGGSGDCDEHSTLIASMALSLGHEAAFKTIAADPDRPEEFSHVYPLIGIQKGAETWWYAADTTQPGGYFGWEPPKAAVLKEKVWPV